MLKKNKLFSIIVVSLNTRSKFIKTINSIVNQKFKNYEIIVIDGGSDDGTIDEINKRKQYINKAIIEKDKGIYFAMNKGIKNSSGSWVIFLNSGDKFYNNKVLDQFNTKKIENYDIIHGNTKISAGSFEYEIKSKKFNETTYFMPFCHQSVLTKRKLFKLKKFDTKYKIAADFEFFYYLFKKKKKFLKIDKIFSKVEAGGISDQNRSQVFKEYKNIYLKYNNKTKLVPIYFLSLVYYKITNTIKLFFGEKLIEKILKLKYIRTR